MKILDIMAIPLTQDLFTLVDGEDFEWLSRWKWHAQKCKHTWYAIRNIYRPRQEKIRMHRLILGFSKGDGKQTDHRNSIGLDNRRENLRECTHAQNMQNRRIQQDGVSQYKGVNWDKKTGKWRAQIQLNGKVKHLGYSNDEVKAAEFYDAKAKELFGEFAHLNLPEKQATLAELAKDLADRMKG